MFPYQKGDNIYIGQSCVREIHKQHYKVFYKKKFVAETFTKTAAVVLARLYERQQRVYLESVLELDGIIEKNYNDCTFYKNTGERTRNTITKAVLEDRLAIGVSKINRAAEQLNILLSK